MTAPAAGGPWPAIACWLLAAVVTGAEGDLEFVRVNVPAEAVRDAPIPAGRYVPMPLADFEEAVAGLAPAGTRSRTVVATDSRYRLTMEAGGVLVGSVEFRLAAAAAWLPAQVPLGRVETGRCTILTADGTGEATAFCLPDGTVAVRTPGPATYACEIRVARPSAVSVCRLPILPALATVLELSLPDGVQPVVVGAEGVAVLIERPTAARSAWRIDLGPVARGTAPAVVFQDGLRAPPPVRAWNCVTVRGRQAEVVARLVPAAAWTAGDLRLVPSPGVRITGVTAAADGRPVPWTTTAGELVVAIPAWLAETDHGLLVTGLTPVEYGRLAGVPVLEPAAARWGGCNTRLVVDPSLAVQRTQFSQCLPVAAGAAGRWPLPGTEPPHTAAGVEPARLFLEHESPGAEALVAIGPREASLDTARVTAVDMGPGTVLGRAAVDIRVVAGEVFGVSADVAPGWFIDSVETVDPGGSRDAAEAAGTGEAVEWRVIRSPKGSELRIGLPLAATPRRSLGLTITGHRSGLPLGAEFSSDDMDMVRFPGETAMLEFQLGPTAVLEAAAGTFGSEPVPERLAPLVSSPAPRARIRAGERAPAARGRIVRRRPPVEADVNVDLVAQDDGLTETFTFRCRPIAGELDAVVVHFSEPMGPGLEWSLVGTGFGGLAAQPLEAGDATRGEMRSEPVVAESWLVELRPASTAAVTFRAARNVPLGSAVAVPLAWVEAAENPGGRVTVRGEPGRRPAVTNRQLIELPPAGDEDPSVTELAYGPPRALAPGGPFAEIEVSATASTAGAWAWRQTTSCWCHDSGDLEWECRFDIENQGREAVRLTLPAGMQAEGVTVGDDAVVATPLGPVPSGLVVSLPRADGRVTLVVRGSGRGDGVFGWWRIGGIGCGIDMPVLDAETALMLPPGLVLAFPPSAADQRDWFARLFGASTGPTTWRMEDQQGFRRIVLATATREAAAVVVVGRRLVASLGLIVAVGAGLAAAGIARRSGPAAIAACAAAAIVATWCGPPWDGPARAAFWGGIVGTWVGSRRPLVPKRIPGVATACLFLVASVAAGDEPLRVYVTPAEDGGTALVPEQLFRRLSTAAAAAGPPAVRVLSTVVEADVGSGTWRVRFTLDADRGGGLQLGQGQPPACWLRPVTRPRETGFLLDGDGRTASVTTLASGRHELELEVRPAVERVGDLVVAALSLPPAPRALLRIVDADGGVGSWTCDRAIGDGPWLPAPLTADACDVAAAARVRLVRSADPRATVPATVRTAVSLNDIEWQATSCRLEASFDVGGEREIVRSLVLRTDAALEPVPAVDRDLAVRTLAPGRHLVEILEPRVGARRVVVGFRMPLADPVGVFDAPSAWLADAQGDVRTVRLRTTPELQIFPEPPPGVTLVRPREEDGGGTTAVWRSETIANLGDGVEVPDPPVRLVVRRRGRPAGAVQDLAVDFADDHVGLRLRCRIDTNGEPLLDLPIAVPPAAIIDGITLTREPGGEDAAESRRQVDLFWSWQADRILAVVQRPEAGRFRLQFDARLPIRPASRGRLPIARLAAADAALQVTCRAAPGTIVRVESPAAAGGGGEAVELPPAAAAPRYTLTRDVPPADEAVPPTEPAEPAGGGVAVSTTVDLAIDGRGRCWGLARFDVVAADQVLRLVVPAGLRLFDVRLDGREATAVPRAEDSWEVRLHDAGWPRTVVAVLYGELGGRLADGGAIRLEPPRLAGLPAGEVLWSIQTPAGFFVRVSEPARVLDPAAFAARLPADRDEFGAAFRAAVRRAEPMHQERFEAFAASRRDGAGPPGELEWYEAWRASAADEPERTLVASAADGSVTIRAVRARAASARGRGLLTAVMLGLAFACWTATRRFPAAAARAAGEVRRWWWLACGLAWLFVLDPPLPGAVMALLGLWAAWPQRWTAPRGAWAAPE